MAPTPVKQALIFRNTVRQTHLYKLSKTRSILIINSLMSVNDSFRYRLYVFDGL